MTVSPALSPEETIAADSVALSITTRRFALELNGDGAPRNERFIGIRDLGIHIERVGVRACAVVGERNARGTRELRSVGERNPRRSFSTDPKSEAASFMETANRTRTGSVPPRS